MSPEPDPIHRLFALSVERSRMSSCLLIPVIPRPLRGACGVLDCGFPGVHTSVHTRSEPSLFSVMDASLNTNCYRSIYHTRHNKRPEIFRAQSME